MSVVFSGIFALTAGLAKLGLALLLLGALWIGRGRSRRGITLERGLSTRWPQAAARFQRAFKMPWASRAPPPLGSAASYSGLDRRPMSPPQFVAR